MIVLSDGKIVYESFRLEFGPDRPDSHGIKKRCYVVRERSSRTMFPVVPAP